MDIRERAPDDEETFRAAFAGLQKQIWTAMPVIVSKDSDGKTVDLTIAIKGQVSDEKGKLHNKSMPPLNSVPIQFAGGGGVTMTHPIKKGDEGVVIFMSRPIGNWQTKGGEQTAVDSSMHSLADGIFIPGVRSNPRALSNVSTTSTQLRSDDGNHVVDVNPTGGVSVKSTKSVTVESSEGAQLKAGTLLVKVTPQRVDLGGEGGQPVLTTGGPSSKVFAVV